MIKQKTFLSYCQINSNGIRRTLYRTKISGEPKTIRSEKGYTHSVSDYLDYHFDLIANHNTLYPHLSLSAEDRQEFESLVRAHWQMTSSGHKCSIKSVAQLVSQGDLEYTVFALQFKCGALTSQRLYSTTNPFKAHTLLSTRCGSGYELIGTFADGAYGEYEQVIDPYSTQCGYDPQEPVVFILDGGDAQTVFVDGVAGTPGASTP